MKCRLAAALASAAWLAVGTAGCAPPLEPCLLLVTFDTTRYDALGFDGNPDAHTPHLDALAGTGMVFDHAYASAGITLPSHATLLTGLEPFAHGVRDNGRFALPAGATTLAERLAGTGWETAAFVSAWVLAPVFGLAQGFEHYGSEVRALSSHPLELGVAQRPADEVTDAALSWLASRGGEHPFFLWAHYYDPHLPRAPAAQRADDPYAAEVALADAELGRLLSGVRASLGGRELVVVFTADHGEAFGEHGEATHALLAYDSTLHVPLLVAGPGVPAGARSDALARHIDLVPTVLAQLGLPPDPELPGRDLVHAARDPEAERSVVGWFESRSPAASLGWAPLDGVRTARWKLTARPPPIELYDVGVDPGELRNVSAERPEVVAQLTAIHREWLAEESASTASATRTTLTPEERERLATLGYVEAAGSWQPGREPDPRRWAKAHALVDLARSAAQAGRHDEAIAGLEAMVHSPALRPLVLRTLAPLHRERGRFEEAALAYADYAELTGAREALWGLAETRLAQGRPADVLDLLPPPAENDRAAGLRARALTALGRHMDARAEVDAHFGGRLAGLHLRALLALDAAPLPDGERELRSLLARAPDDAELGAMLGFHLAAWGAPDQRVEAASLLRRARDAVPDSADVLSHVAWGLYKLGFSEEAVVSLEATLEHDPARHLDRVRLAVLLAERGERRRARELLEESVASRPAAPWAGEARAALAELERGEREPR